MTRARQQKLAGFAFWSVRVSALGRTKPNQAAGTGVGVALGLGENGDFGVGVGDGDGVEVGVGVGLGIIRVGDFGVGVGVGLGVGVKSGVGETAGVGVGEEVCAKMSGEDTRLPETASNPTNAVVRAIKPAALRR